jgi:hypothetical protein
VTFGELLAFAIWGHSISKAGWRLPRPLKCSTLAGPLPCCSRFSFSIRARSVVAVLAVLVVGYVSPEHVPSLMTQRRGGSN